MKDPLERIQGPSGFFHLGIAPSLLEAINALGLAEPTPIQRQTIPIVIEGKDVLGIAQTGTGKTYAFGIPLIQRIAQIKKQALIVLPTRDLADQVHESLSALGKRFKLRTAVVIGGASQRQQTRSLARSPHVIIATPGRLNDHLSQLPDLLARVGIVVLDEADRMLDMGFAPQIKKIFERLPRERQTLLFSATMPREIMSLAHAYMHIPVRVEIARAGTLAEHVTQELFMVEKSQKLDLLITLLDRYLGPALVFTKTKYGARSVVTALRESNIRAAEMHSNRSLAQRRAALEGFKQGSYRVLVATDIASRGIDVLGIELVVNFDIPATPDDYVHRIGRTARAGAVGHAITFVMPEQKKDMRAIEHLTRTLIPVSKLPLLKSSTVFREAPPSRPRFSNRGKRRHSSPQYHSQSRKSRPSEPHSKRRSPRAFTRYF